MAASDIVVTVNGTDRTTFTNRYECSVDQNGDGTPDAAVVMLRGFTPTVGMEVKIVQGGSVTLFDGEITDVELMQRRTGTRQRYRCTCADWTFLLDRRLVSGSWTATASNIIVSSIISGFTSGFTTTNVESSLTAVDFSAFMEPVSSVLQRLANAVGAVFKVRYDKDIYFRMTSNISNPATLDSTNTTFKDLFYHKSIQQIRNRIYVQGGPAQPAVNTVPANGTQIAVASTAGWSAGKVRVGNQLYSYSASYQSSTPVADTTRSSTAIGATVVLINTPADFNAGVAHIQWAFGDLYVTYTSVNVGLLRLEGVPASGPGSVTIAVPTGTKIVDMPCIITGSAIAAGVHPGDPIALIVQRDDATSQTAMAAAEGGDGVHEFFITSADVLTVSACNTYGDAELNLGKNVQESATYTSEDSATVPGASAVINIAGISTTIPIAHVSISWIAGRKNPQRAVSATSQYKTFSQYLADLQGHH